MSQLEEIAYTSMSFLDESERDSIVDRIVSKATRYNAQCGFSGVLIQTRGRFAQIFEGPPEFLDPLLQIIRNDERHDNVRMIIDRQITQRAIAQWSLRYFGLSLFVAIYIDSAFDLEAGKVGIAPSERLGELLIKMGHLDANGGAPES